jgi:dihydropteroate synthase
MRAAQSARRDGFLRTIGVRPIVMGILNVTPDSFSDGGAYVAVDAALAHAKQMVVEGCDILDVGGESTRPGATPLSAADELSRIEPVLATLGRDLDVPLSIDTYKAKVAVRAVELGAVLVNDVWGLQKDPAMPEVVAATQAAVVIMHNRAEKDASVDILVDIRAFFDRSLELAGKAGIRKDRIILDPGIGFAKTSHQNRDALARLGELKDYALPIMVGASRKTFLGGLGDGSEGSLFGTIAVNLAAAANGASIFRVHDVGANRAALNVFAHFVRGASTDR